MVIKRQLYEDTKKREEGNKMKKFLLILIIVSLSACDSNFSSSSNSYDSGYVDEYTGAISKSKKSDYLSGYYDGEFDSECGYLKDENKWSEFKKLRCF